MYALKRGKNNKKLTDMKINIRMYALVYHDTTTDAEGFTNLAATNSLNSLF